VPFFTPSVQLGVAQRPPLQVMFAQSLGVLHFFPVAHRVIQLPPQSTSDSVPSTTPLEHACPLASGVSSNPL
jgi:hypothetical protein